MPVKVSQRMKSELVTIQATASLLEALEQMLTHRIRHLIVLDEQGQLFGVATDRDLRFAMPSRLMRVEPEERDKFLAGTAIEQVCIRNPVTISPDDGLRQAAVLMRKGKIGCLPVTEGARVLGIVTSTDIVDAFIDLVQPADDRG